MRVNLHPNVIFAASHLAVLVLVLVSVGANTRPVGNPHYREYFYIGAQYVEQGPPTDGEAAGSDSLLAEGQIYVEHLIPAHGVTQNFPLLMLHGAGMTATNFLNTPDGRMGWVDWFLGQGYEVRLPSIFSFYRAAYSC